MLSGGDEDEGGSSRRRCRRRAPRPRSRSSPCRSTSLRIQTTAAKKRHGNQIKSLVGIDEDEGRRHAQSQLRAAYEGLHGSGWGANWAAAAAVLGDGLGRSWAVEAVELGGRAPRRRKERAGAPRDEGWGWRAQRANAAAS